MPNRLPQVGEPAPWFAAASPVNKRFHFDSVAGRHVVLCFFGSASHPASRRILDDALARRDVFNDLDVSFFGVSIDPVDNDNGLAPEVLPGIHQFRDFDRKVSELYGVITDNQFRPVTLVLDERLRVYAVLPITGQPEQHVPRVLNILEALAASRSAVPAMAPVLIVPRIFEPALCRRLIEYYNEGGDYDSGFMREVDGKTVGMYDYSHKRRSDKDITDEALLRTCMARIHDRLAPEIHKAFQFSATRIERHIVAHYDAATGGHFRAHRDNTTKGTAHRRFAVSLVLNTGEFEGGRLRFPEFGRQTYSPPAGGAVVFSCSLLHEATPVTAGHRYCYLPFLYDDAAAHVRAENQKFLGGTLAPEAPLEGS